MATEHMVQLPHIELGDKWGTSSMKMQTGSSMCSGPAGLGETAVFLFISLSRERFNCHMAELAGPHQDFCWHHGLCGSCAGGGLTSQGSWARGGVYMCPAHVIPALAVVWLGCLSLLAAKQLGSNELTGLWQGRSKKWYEELEGWSLIRA